MKKLSTISLFIFGVVVTAILTAGLVFYQNNKTSSSSQNSSADLIKSEISKINPNGGTLTLDMKEITKHNSSTDCWMLIGGNVYDITSFFGSHPGGNSVMSSTCGTDATDAYLTKDPNAKSTTGGQDHSSRARDMLKQYYLGTLNQTIGSGTQSSATKTVSSSTNTSVSVKTTTAKINSVSPVTLNLSEISKHNKQSDCWMLISGKVYTITSFFGSHPGGNGTMLATCGTDATAAYMTKDPNATSSGSRSSHSSNAVSMLSSYYIGDLNQTIGQQKVIDTSKVIPPKTMGDEEEFDD